MAPPDGERERERRRAERKREEERRGEERRAEHQSVPSKATVRRTPGPAQAAEDKQGRKARARDDPLLKRFDVVGIVVVGLTKAQF